MEGKKHDTGKPRYNLIPVFSNQELAKVLTFGAEKYGAENWRKVDNAEDRYLSAAMRHIEAYRMGEITDQESGLHHLAHANACLSFITEVDLNE
tara:strand:+ start:20250 stop:20531 length:282 start_codon:yes stop_codon:yes gene_type:complete